MRLRLILKKLNKILLCVHNTNISLDCIADSEDNNRNVNDNTNNAINFNGNITYNNIVNSICDNTNSSSTTYVTAITSNDSPISEELNSHGSLVFDNDTSQPQNISMCYNTYYKTAYSNHNKSIQEMSYFLLNQSIMLF